MRASVLLLDEGSALALIGVVAIVAVCLLALTLVGLVFFVLYRRDPPVAAPAVGVPAAAPQSLRKLEALGSVRRSPSAVRGVEIDVPTRHADLIIQALQQAGWKVHETGEVVATDEDEEGLTTLSVDVPSGAKASSGEEVH